MEKRTTAYVFCVADMSVSSRSFENLFRQNYITITPQNSMRQILFDNYFSETNIIDLLCKYRIKIANINHQRHINDQISTIAKSKIKLNKQNELLFSILPPRRKWHRLNTQHRKRIDSSQKLAVIGIKSSISFYQNISYEKPIWLGKLNKFVNKLISKYNNVEVDVYKIDSPTIHPIHKNNKSNCKEFRPLSLFSIESKIIVSLAARYLIDAFDPVFLECSLAFRSKLNRRVSITHHDAIESILSYCELNKRKDIWIAECDIKKFFDCVNHDIVIEKFEFLAQEEGILIDERIRYILKSYLESYSFNKDVFPKNSSPFFKKMDESYFDWPKDELNKNFYTDNLGNSYIDQNRIGIPQGGAISCFIANLLLHEVDQKMISVIDDGALYIRYCDDMIVLHTQQETCLKALNTYEKALKDIKLLAHEPIPVVTYCRDFWEFKSKLPYKWGPKSIEGCVPWLSFVGYQVRYDGQIRVRKKSIEKELTKQKDSVRNILKSLNIHNKNKKFEERIDEISLKSFNQHIYSLESRLISMSVGRISLYDLRKPQGLCWTNGFKKLKNNPIVESQLKKLDRSRTRNILFLKRKLSNLNRKSTRADKSISKKMKNTRYFGSPYSYHGFLKKE